MSAPDGTGLANSLLCWLSSMRKNGRVIEVVWNTEGLLHRDTDGVLLNKINVIEGEIENYAPRGPDQVRERLSGPSMKDIGAALVFDNSKRPNRGVGA